MHLAVQVEGAFGPGTLLTTTLCGRSSQESEDGFNSAEAHNEVTCAFCRKIIADPANWRHRKYLKH